MPLPKRGPPFASECLYKRLPAALDRELAVVKLREAENGASIPMYTSACGSAHCKVAIDCCFAATGEEKGSIFCKRGRWLSNQ